MNGTRRRDWARMVVGGGLSSLPWVAGATAVPAGVVAQVRPEPGAARPAAPRLGLALGAGSARGFAHIGVLKSLDQAGIKPDVVVGTSAGALVGAFYAAGYSPWQIETVALNVKDAEVADFATASKRGMLVGDSLWQFVNETLKGARIESLRTKFAAVATDLRSGEVLVLRSGPVADAVRASCSIPGVFIPRELGGRELVDGGLVSPLPVKAARQLGCDIVIAVDVGTRPNRAALPGMFEVLLQSFEIMGRALAEHEALQADVVLRPDTSQYASSDFSVRREMIQSGYEITQRHLPDLRRRLDSPSRGRRG
jgi:NTE family protein